jgi:ribosome-associated translation inhibitor RaiA
MTVRIQYEGVKQSPWMKEYMERKVSRLERYLSTGSQIIIELISSTGKCITHLKVKTLKHTYDFEKEGPDLFAAFTETLEEAAKVLRSDHMKLLRRVKRIE